LKLCAFYWWLFEGGFNPQNAVVFWAVFTLVSERCFESHMLETRSLEDGGSISSV